MQTIKKRGFMENNRIIFIRIDDIVPNPSQPRKVFDPVSLSELAASIVQYGVLQPLTVRRRGERYELVAGERRLRAAKIAGFSEVPCIQLGIDEEQSSMIALVENLQRRDLDFIEEAEGLARLMRLYGLSQDQAAMRVGKSQSAIANKLRILRHSPRALRLIRENGLSERHARALLKLDGEESRYEALRYIIKKGLNVAQTESYVDSLIKEKEEEQPREKRSYLMKDIRFFLNTINHNLEIIQSAGIPADCGKTEDDKEIILTIKIPKQAG